MANLDNSLATDKDLPHFEQKYPAPLSALLKIGDPRGKPKPNYLTEYGLTKANIPGLIQMMEDEALETADSRSKIVWTGVHVWRTLGALRATEAIAPFL
mgnify:CR=1 FL=1